MLETDEFVSSNSEGFIMDSITISTAYLKMKNLCTNISSEIQADIKIHNQHILPRYGQILHLKSIYLNGIGSGFQINEQKDIEVPNYNSHTSVCCRTNLK